MDTQSTNVNVTSSNGRGNGRGIGNGREKVMVGEWNHQLEVGEEGKEGEVHFQDVLHRFLDLEIRMVLTCPMTETSSQLMW